MRSVRVVVVRRRVVERGALGRLAAGVGPRWLGLAATHVLRTAPRAPPRRGHQLAVFLAVFAKLQAYDLTQRRERFVIEAGEQLALVLGGFSPVRFGDLGLADQLDLLLERGDDLLGGHLFAVDLKRLTREVLADAGDSLLQLLDQLFVRVGMSSGHGVPKLLPHSPTS